MNLATKKAIIKANYELLHRVVALRKADMWARVKRLILTTEEFESVLIESAKLEISSHLDAIAKVCDKLTIEKDLIVIIDRFYLTVSPTTSQTVKQNTIKILSEVLKELSLDIREKYADVYQTTLNLEANKWRLRYVISEQIDTLSRLFKPETVLEKVIPMYFAFCRDHCAVVRKSASRLFHRLYLNVADREDVRNILLVNLKSFGSYKRFVLRQSFVLMAESVLMNVKDWHDDEVTDILLELANDRVVNVRLTVARLLVNLSQKGIEKELVVRAKTNLLRDVDQDLFELLKPIFPGDEAKTLLNAFEKRRSDRQTAAAAEKARVESIKAAKGIKVAPGKTQTTLQQNASVVAANAYRQLLQNAFELTENPNAKELLEDLQLTPQTLTPQITTPTTITNHQTQNDDLNLVAKEKIVTSQPNAPEHEKKVGAAAPEEEGPAQRRNAHLEPFVDVDIAAPTGTPLEVQIADKIAHQLSPEVKKEASEHVHQLNKEINEKMPAPEEVAVAKEEADTTDLTYSPGPAEMVEDVQPSADPETPAEEEEPKFEHQSD